MKRHIGVFGECSLAMSLLSLKGHSQYEFISVKEHSHLIDVYLYLGGSGSVDYVESASKKKDEGEYLRIIDDHFSFPTTFVSLYDVPFIYFSSAYVGMANGTSNMYSTIKHAAEIYLGEEDNAKIIRLSPVFFPHILEAEVGVRGTKFFPIDVFRSYMGVYTFVQYVLHYLDLFFSGVELPKTLTFGGDTAVSVFGLYSYMRKAMKATKGSKDCAIVLPRLYRRVESKANIPRWGKVNVSDLTRLGFPVSNYREDIDEWFKRQ